MTLEDFVRLLREHMCYITGSAPNFKATCPAHEDNQPSLSIGPGTDGAPFSYKCHAGCSKDEIRAALSLPAAKSDADFHGRAKPTWTTEYGYTSEVGATLYVKERGEPKTFRIYRPLTGGRRQYKSVFVGPGAPQKVLYHLPELMAGIQAGEPVHVVEGEKDVHTAEGLGLIATCNVEGAAKEGQRTKWLSRYGDSLKGAHVVIVRDRDDAGRAHAKAIAADLQGKAASVKVVEAKEGKDLTDHVKAGYGVEDLIEVTGTEEVRRPDLRIVASIDGANVLADEPDKVSQNADDPEVGYDIAGTFNLPGKVTVPAQYRLDRRGVWLKKMVKENGVEKPTWIRVSFAPLVVTGTLRDPDDEQSVELSWLDRGKVVSKVVPRDVAKRGRELIKQLGNANLPVIEADSRLVERWLAEFEASNRQIRDQYLARYLGWQPDGTFVASPHGDVKVEVLHDEQRTRARAFGQHGTLKGWQEAVKELAAHQVPRVVIAASLAASLLRPLGISSFTVDVSSRSTKGKTTCLQCGLSAWANPSEQADAMANWRTTLFAIEKTLNLVRGMVTVLDETMAVDDETLIDQVLYQLPMNHGKSRSGGYASMLPWETILLSSGEQPALSFTTAQGAAARILGTTKPPFGDNGGDMAVRAREGVLANYGHAGPAFVEQLRRDLASKGGPDRLKQQHQQLRDQFKGGNDMTARRAPMVALLALAEKLACEWKILPYEPMPAESWRRLFAADSPTDNRPEMAMDVVREYIAGHAWELWPSDSDRPPLHGWLGAEKQVNGESRVAIMPERLKKILADASYKLDAVEQAWIASGYLELSKSQKPAHKIPIRINSKQARCYVFTKKALESAEATQEAL